MDLQKYKVDNEMKVTFELLEDILVIERNTCRALFEGLVTEEEPIIDMD